MENKRILIESIGFIAALCTTSAFLSQVIHLFRTRTTDGISLLMYVIYTVGVSLWLVYGLILTSPALIFADFITLIFVISVLILKLKWK